jgi:hypothetical protein
MTKEEILKAIRVCERKLKRNPNKRELRAMAGISERTIYTQLGCLQKALEAAGLEASGAGFTQEEETLLLDWGKVARKLKRLPSVMEYQRAGRFSGTPFHKRYGSWTRVPEAFQRFVQRARSKGLRREWREVLEMVQREGAVKAEQNSSRKEAGRRARRGGLLCGRPIYGRPLHLPELAHEPTNEMGVMFVFALMARRLGFVVQRLQMGFPDCEALREVAPGQWQRVWIELEFESRNFAKHRHRHDGCDVIVCWKHNWKDCPLEVIELKKAISDQHSAFSQNQPTNYRGRPFDSR